MEVSKRALRDELIALEDASRDVRTLFRSRETTVVSPNNGGPDAEISSTNALQRTFTMPVASFVPERRQVCRVCVDNRRRRGDMQHIRLPHQRGE